MKKLFTLSVLFISIVYLFSASIVTRGKNFNRDKIVRFDYTNQKFEFSEVEIIDGSYEALSKVPYQLPEELLSQLTTEELILFCGDHPTFARPRSSWKPEHLREFNGFKELIRRDDYLNVLLSVLDELKNGGGEGTRFHYTLSLFLFYSKTLYDCFDNEQITRHLKMIKTLSASQKEGILRPEIAYYFF